MKFRAKLLALSIVAAITAFIWRDTFVAESIRGAKVLVTGASTGIGEQMAYHYARLGAQIVITARRESVLKEVAERCLELGAQKALYVPGDMGTMADPESVVKFAVEALGGLDYLVLNHIGPSPYEMWNRDIEHVRWLMQVNFFSYLQMTTSALPHLEDSGGAIIVVSSLLGKMCNPFVAPYSATKFSLNGFFGTLQHELAMQRKNVSITICVLGLIDTDNAMEKIKDYSSLHHIASPASDAALHIISAGATRQKESFFPFYVYFITLFRDWFAFFRDLTIQNSYHYEP
ncbi:hydroxysteroid 11-beta-dehydrogenase 1-like protein isoform X1 [Conger conger]|uniref:hydroxysteroid 11-beta-dehydrogenase 1-like protein isoform X1 n=2 Tax=Conger conger TaxID=82655 RepID=UPI002A5B10C8|nr:hydroxysteroid 11-beta-dehydrogenase 1-like protein isoform X1 [Conger conger]